LRLVELYTSPVALFSPIPLLFWLSDDCSWLDERRAIEM
jgi:hypothetical protein